MTHYQRQDVPGNMDRPLVIYGSGSHGQVIAEAAQVGGWEVLGFLDDAPRDEPGEGVKLLTAQTVIDQRACVIVGIGDNLARRRVMDDARKAHWNLTNIIHPSAWVSPSVTLGRGIFIGPHAVVHTHAELEDGVIVNSGAVVEHHARIGAYAHIAPGAAMGGQVTVGELSLVGVNASILPRMRLGKGCTVGAGAVVTHDVPNHVTVTGVPAKQR